MGARRLNFGGTENESWRTEDESRGMRDVSCTYPGHVGYDPAACDCQSDVFRIHVAGAYMYYTLGSAGLRHKPELRENDPKFRVTRIE